MNLKQQQSEWQSKVEQLQLCNSQMEKQLEEKSFQVNNSYFLLEYLVEFKFYVCACVCACVC